MSRRALAGPARGVLIGLFGGLCCLLGCSSARTPEAACEQLLHALAEGDPSSVFDALLQTTQWSFHSVVKNHKKMHALIRESYPAAQQAAALGRLYGAEASSGRDLFVRLYPDRYEKDFTQRQGSGPMQVTPAAGGAAGERLCGRQGGRPFMLKAAASGKWGMSELDREWDEAQLRAYHDLATVQKNAELYRGVQPALK